MVTAYCPCPKCCEADSDGITSIGKSAFTKGIAAAPKALPYGTQVYVRGFGTYKVDDTGGAMRRAWRDHREIHIDLRMGSHQEAKNWGRKHNVPIYILLGE